MRPLYVRLPDEAADKLDRAAFELKTPKQNIVAQLLANPLTVGRAEFFPNDDPVKDIAIYINCPGGVVYAGLAIYDTMQFIKPEIQTTCIGMAMSMGSLLLAGGTPGKRFALPNSKILIHQPSGGFEGQATDI